MQLVVHEENIFKLLGMNDQGCFELAGDLKCPNCRYWSIEISKRPLHGVKVTLCCSAVRDRVIRLLF